MNSSDATFAQSPGFTPLQPVSCRYFAVGACKYGNACQYPHPRPQPVIPAPGEEFKKRKIDPEPAYDPRKYIPCRYFALGGCWNGVACLFSHEADLEIPQDTTDDFDKLEDDDTGVREIGGAVVQFGEGATVSTVSLRTEFSSFRMTYLPADTTAESVELLLAEAGVIIEPNNTRVITTNSDEASIVDIRTAEPLSLKDMRTNVTSMPRGKDVRIKPIPQRLGGGLNTIDGRKVHCSWYRPVRAADLNFGSRQVATKASRAFQTGKYKICGREVVASTPTACGITSACNPEAFSVILSNLPSSITTDEILDPIGRDTIPRHTNILPPTYDDDVSMATAQVQSLLAGIGELNGAPVVSTSSVKRLKMQAKFLHEGDARAAVSKLHNSKLPFYPKERLTVQRVVSAKFKVVNRIYQAVERRINAHKPAWIHAKVFPKVYPPTAAFTWLKLEGQDTKKVASAKKELDRILAGHIVKHKDQVVWSESWGKMKNLSHILKPVEEAFQIFIWRDTIRRQLRAYGSTKECERATRRLIELAYIGDDLPLEIPLSPDDFRWACQGGHNQLSSALGAKSATLDIVSTPKRIIIHGSLEDYEKAVSFIRAAKKQVAKTVPLTDKGCSACWTEAESPIRTQCGHLYCTGCFEYLCSSKSATDSDKAIRCVGDEDTCKRILPLGELKEHLPSSTLEDILGASFSSYVVQNPAKLRYCPTPYCDAIYRVAREGVKATQTHKCEGCLVSLCTSCHASHQNQSCGEYKSQLLGLKAGMPTKELGIRDCPRCKTSMEKTDRCDHKTCRGCGAHICWKCLETFKTGVDYYDHLEPTGKSLTCLAGSSQSG